MNPVFHVVIIGGDARRGPAVPAHIVTRKFGSRRNAGNTALARAKGAIRPGRVDLVVLMVRWLGHPTSKAIRKHCARVGVPCRFVDGAHTAASRTMKSFMAEVCNG